MRLRVHINQQDSLTRFGKSAAEVYRYRSFATTTFLIDHRYGFHSFTPDHKNKQPKKTLFRRKQRLPSAINTVKHLLLLFGKKTGKTLSFYGTGQ
jgi:hypothetical protein